MRKNVIAMVASLLLVVATLVGCSSSTNSPYLQYKKPPEHKGAYGEHADEIVSEFAKTWQVISIQYDDMEVFERERYNRYISLNDEGGGWITHKGKNGKSNGYSLFWEASSEDDLKLYHDTWVDNYPDEVGGDVFVYIPIDAHYDAKEETLYVDGTEYGTGGTMRLRDMSKDLEAPALWQKGSEHEVASADEVLGGWELTGFTNSRVTTVGEGDSIAAWLEKSVSTAITDKSLTFKRDGSGKMLGSDMEWKVADGKCTLSRVSEDRTFSVLKVDDSTLLVASEKGTTYRLKRYE